MGKIEIEVYEGTEEVEFDKGLSFHEGAVIEASGQESYLTRVNPNDDNDRSWTCAGNGVRVTMWDEGNGWMAVTTVEGEDSDVERFWSELERLCSEEMRAGR